MDNNRATNKNMYKCDSCGTSFPMELVAHIEFDFCPECGNLLPKAVNYIENYFRIIQLAEPLRNAVNLLLKTECVAGVRDAIVTFEDIVRKESDLSELMGPDLMAKAFGFKFDTNTNTLIQPPRIHINRLSNLTERNEQEGVKYLAMGLMQGIRNIYIHTKGTEKLYYCLQIIATTDLLLKQVLGWESIPES